MAKESPSKRRKKLKLVDVARAAGVSVATVSRLMTAQVSVTPKLRERIVDAAVKMGFDLEGKKKSRIIAFLLSNRGVLHPFHSSVLMGAEAYCAERDYGLLFLPFHYSSRIPSDELHLPGVMRRRQIVSGVIVAGTSSQNLLDLLTRKAIPWVVLGNNVVGEWRKEESNTIYSDDLSGAAEMTRQLQSLGHKRIGFVGNRRLPWFARRYEGYKQAMEAAGLQPRIAEADSDDAEEIGYVATRLLLQRSESITAVFAGDDVAAQGAYKALRASGLVIPDDVSVAGFNDAP